MGSAWWIASHRRKLEIIKFMGLPRLNAFCKCLFVYGLFAMNLRLFSETASFQYSFTPGCENPRLTSLYLFIFVFIQDGLGMSLGNYSIWAQSNNAFLRDGLRQNIYKHVLKPSAQGTQQQIVRYTSPKATMLWTMCLDDISSCHRQCCLYCCCWVWKDFGSFAFNANCC